ncbi:MAG TPA: tRNA pseudouridine(54/55) synthase Pus10 [archaeon]|nr:tRNA pseudouridine(54/55) synthase Pus10 [archaeon]
MKVGLVDFSDEQICKKCLEAISGIEFVTFAVGVSSQDSAAKLRVRGLVEGFVSKSKSVKAVKENFDLYLMVNLERGIVESTPSPIFIEGFYNKFSRDVAQTFHYCFICKGRGCKKCNFSGKLTELSVQEIVEKIILPEFEAKESFFHGCGREDVDVRMLGKGRPFVVEIAVPKKRSADLGKIEAKINSSAQGKIALNSLKFCSKERVVLVKNTEFSKIYLAKCFCEIGVLKKELEWLIGKEVKIVQRTPVRVEKRRPDKEREKGAKILRATYISENEFEVEILATHGLYVKEFVSGDSSRTNPSISSLLSKECVCKELDVLEIVIEKKEG